MKTFEEFVLESAWKSGGVNLFFEAGMYSLSSDLEPIVKALRDAGVDFELIGGVAVNAYIFAVDPSRSFVTRDIDVLIRRDDMERGAKAAEPLALGGPLHLIPTGEAPFHSQAMQFLGMALPVAPLPDLLRRALNSLRPIDMVHLEILDDAGLITPALEQELPEALRERLAEARRQIAEGRPDVES